MLYVLWGVTAWRVSETKFPWKLAKDYATKIYVRHAVQLPRLLLTNVTVTWMVTQTAVQKRTALGKLLLCLSLQINKKYSDLNL